MSSKYPDIKPHARTRWMIISLMLSIAGLGLILVSAQKSVILIVDGERRSVRTYARTVDELLGQLDVGLGTGDHLQPDPTHRLVNGDVIQLQRARPVSIWEGGEAQTLQSVETSAGNLLAEAGVNLFPGDEVFAAGRPIKADQTLPGETNPQLAIVRAVPVTLIDGPVVQTFSSTAPTLGQALWENGVVLYDADQISPPLETPLTEPVKATLIRSRPIVIRVGDSIFRFRTIRKTVGAALADAGIALQGLDYSLPPESASLPADGRVRVVRVREEVSLEQEPLPFETEFRGDPELEIDNQQLISRGEYGLKARRVRVRYEDGLEVSRDIEGEWVAVEPKPRVMGYGTKIVVRKLDTASGTIEYWRAVQMYATSYSPCRIFADRCSSRTYSGDTLKKGVAAVVRRWYPSMGGSRIYVPGYGTATILDIGGGIAGRNWIDLGYDDDSFVSWHQWVTVYFLTPVPPTGNIRYILN